MTAVMYPTVTPRIRGMAPKLRRVLKPWEFLPELVVVGGLGFFLVTKTDAALASFTSPRALALVGAGVVAWVVGRFLLRMWLRSIAIQFVLFGLAGLGALAVILVPAYRVTTVVETPPPPAAAAPATGTPAAGTAAAAAVGRTGTFQGIDHRAKGTVTFSKNGATSVIGLIDFEIEPGPDYKVYVVPGADQRKAAGGTRIEALRGNKGTQYYEAPAGIDLTSGEWTLLIWCEIFGVPIANATPR